MTSRSELIALQTMLAPLLKRVSELEPASCDSPETIAALEHTLSTEFPWSGAEMQALGEELRRGVEEGWLCDHGDAKARFSRVAKPSEQTHALSIDVVSMVGEAIEHSHPKGEVTIGFPHDKKSEGSLFEGREPGWVFLGPKSRHIPTVSGERMNLLYFLPDGAVTWHFKE